LNPERWAQIEELFHRATDCAPGERCAFLDKACGNDTELRREVEALLSFDANASASVRETVRGGLEDAGFPLTGEIISHYRILDGLGGGGMGLVYRAEDIKLGRKVALKFLPEESVKDPAALGRFEREARSASALEHPNICPIYEFGEHEGQPFLVMQLLEGQTLRELIAAAGPGKPPLELKNLLDLAVQILDGVDAAHQKGIIHRDIKPANVFVTHEGQAKILDFGLAKLASLLLSAADDHESQPLHRTVEPVVAHANLPVSTPDMLLSRTGVAMGTAGYMSPEQVRGEKLDQRTDLFSFGLVLYELATGKRAFEGDTGPELQEAILTKEPSPAHKVNPAVPEKLAKILQRALEKDREKRYQSATEMRADLQSLGAEMAPKRRTPSWAIAAAAICALSVLGTVIWYAKRSSRSSVALPAIKLRQLTSNSGENPVGSGTISPDGKFLAYTDKTGMYLKRIETGETRLIPPPADLDPTREGLGVGRWFPDGTKFLAVSCPLGVSAQLMTSQGSSIWIVSVSGGPPRKIRDEAFLESISPDGSLVSFETHKGRFLDREIWVMAPDGEQARKLFEVDENSSIFGLGWSQDGKRVIFQRQDGPNPADSYFMSGDLNGGPLTKIPPPFAPEKMMAALWMPDNRLVYGLAEPGFKVMTCNLFQIRLNSKLTEFIGMPQRLTNFAELCPNPLNSTADGKQMTIYEWRPHSNVYVVDLQAGGTRASASARLTLDESWNHPLAWTADSNAVLFSSNRIGVDQVFKQSPGQTNAEPLLTLKNSENLTGACLSPDGSWIIFMMAPEKEGPISTNKIMGNSVTPADPTAKNSLMRVPITGGSPQLVFTASIEEWPRCAPSPSTLCIIAERSADSTQLIFTAFDPLKGRGRELARSNVNPTTYYHWDLSPDGTRIALLKHLDDRIQLISLSGAPPQPVEAKGKKILMNLKWAADGKGLFVASSTSVGSAILHLDLQGNTRLLWEHTGSGEPYAVPSPDGRRLAIRGWIVDSNVWLMENF
jgi:serine/threonine protein kinase